jgi:flavin-dependent dehydrogenase
VIQEIIVIGAGVAGSTVARRLRALGATVALVGGESRPGIEGLSERGVQLLREEGVDAGALPAMRTGIWGARRIEGREWLIERERLARMLRHRAGDAGAELHRGPACHLRRDNGIWRVSLAGGTVLQAPWLIDARGRRGAALSGPRLLAVSASFRSRTESAPATRIEPFGSGWCWWARCGKELYVQITRRPRVAPPETWLSTAMRGLPELMSALEGAVCVSGLRARPAHARRAAGAIQSGWRAGDAAWAPDPLSGQGVYEALRSAQLIATAMGSVLEGGDLELARRFVAERQEHAYERAVRIAAEFYRENGERGEFWGDTAQQYQGLLRDPPNNIEPHIEPRPVLLSGRIVLRDVLITPRYPRGIWQAGRVPVARPVIS